ncbi:hypothetical protein [Arenibaculum sp.]|jgi:hypothetical protein|uniref:hypothetical protein n=1 Tax=Arenibaculum sp. TaxID=2865862 RepID=UPI002E1404CF|nr:hypothetical protein [Arenibaculum sp.]
MIRLLLPAAAACLLAGCAQLTGAPTEPSPSAVAAGICAPDRWDFVQEYSGSREVDRLQREARRQYESGDVASCRRTLGRAEAVLHRSHPE